MMKSFFKKLAFVMALAMVVSMVTPAGAVFAADAAGIALQTAKSDAEIKESDNIAVGAKVDYKFYGAPANWKKMGLKWTSSNEAVATVDQTGLVTGVADGVATIDLKSADGTYAVSMKVVVGKGDMTYTYKQVTHEVAAFTFKQDVEYTVDDVTLTKVFDGGYEVNWPIESFSCEKNVVAITPYVDFADGDKYIVRIGAEDEGTEFTTTLGVVDYVEVAWESLDKEARAFAKLGEDDEDISVELSVKLFSNGVNVTEANGYDLSAVEFEAVTESEDFELDEDVLVFEKPGVPATIRVVYTYEDSEGEEKEVENFATIISEPAPKYTIVSVDKWTIAPTENASDEDLWDDLEIDWNGKLVHSMPAFDDEKNEYALVLLMTDSYGNKLVYPSDFAAKSKKLSNGKKPLAFSAVTTKNLDTSIEAAEDFEIVYTSTNENKIFVGPELGEITTLGESKAPILVSLYDVNSEGETVLAKNLFAASVEVTSERKPTTIKAELWFDKLLVNVDDLTEISSSYEEGQVEFTVYDQYGDKVNDAAVVLVADYEKLNESADATVEKLTGEDPDVGSGKTVHTFEGKDFIYEKTVKGVKQDVVANNVKFTATVKVGSTKYDKVKTTFTVKTAVPETEKVDNVLKLEVDGHELYAKNIDQYIEAAEDGTTLETKVRLYQLSNDMRVGYENTTLVTASDTGYFDEDGKFVVKSNETTKGAYYTVVYNPDGEPIAKSTSGSLGIYEDGGTKGKYRVVAATKVASKVATNTSVMTYLDEGTYTMKIYVVDKLDTKDGVATTEPAKLKELTKTFEVTNSSEKISVAEQQFIDLPANEVTARDVEEAIFAAFNFKIGDGRLYEPEAEYDGDKTSNIFILARKTKYNANAKSLFVYEVTFAVPLNNGSDTVWYEYTVSVNKSVKVGSEFGYVADEVFNKEAE